MKKALFKIASRLILHPWFRITRGTTLGVRTAIINDNNEILLIRHSYAPGWLFPGGGVEAGETIYQAAIREAGEEAGILAQMHDLELFGLYANEKHFKGDHIALFVVKQFDRQAWKPTAEIREAKFFPRQQLPDGITNGTRQRLAEIFDGHPKDQNW